MPYIFRWYPTLCKIFYDFGQKSGQNIWNLGKECAIFAPAFGRGHPGGEGWRRRASREGRRGERGGAGEGTGNQPVFQQFRKNFEKICGKIWRERIKTFIFASAFARKNRLMMNDE